MRRERSAALLRREGLYSSHLSTWKRQRGALKALGPRKRGCKAPHPGQPQLLFKELQQQLLLTDDVVFLLECLQQFRHRWWDKNRRFLW